MSGIEKGSSVRHANSEIRRRQDVSAARTRSSNLENPASYAERIAFFILNSATVANTIVELIKERDNILRACSFKPSHVTATAECDSKIAAIVKHIEVEFWNDFGHELLTGAISSTQPIDNT